MSGLIKGFRAYGVTGNGVGNRAIGDTIPEFDEHISNEGYTIFVKAGFRATKKFKLARYLIPLSSQR
jgi:hypothetical protein